MQGLVLPTPTSRHAIGPHIVRLVDHSRRDPWTPSKPVREFMVQVWYPAERADGRRREGGDGVECDWRWAARCSHT